MKRFGATGNQMKKTSEQDVFLLRLHLLIVIVKAALKGYPLGKHRKKAALDTASMVHNLIASLDISFLDLDTASHLFKERVKLLTIMAAAIMSETYPLGVHRREAVLDNIEMITQLAFHQKNLKLFHSVLKVA